MVHDSVTVLDTIRHYVEEFEELYKENNKLAQENGVLRQENAVLRKDMENLVSNKEKEDNDRLKQEINQISLLLAENKRRLVKFNHY